MRPLIHLFLLATVCVLASAAMEKQKKQYRAEKINYIYEKALQHINDKKRLNKFEDELTRFDSVYMDTKDLHASGKKTLKDMANIDEKLLAMLDKYGLKDTLDAFKMKKKLRNEHEMQAANLALPSEKFADAKLQQLWQAAQESFGESELQELHADLKEAERKNSEYDKMLREFNKVPTENAVHPDDDVAGVEQGARIQEDKNQRLKEANRDLHEHLAGVRARIQGTNTGPFESDRVNKLWKAAQLNGNFTAHDLTVLREELGHFDKQLRKIAFHKEELSRSVDPKNNFLEDAELSAKQERMQRKLGKLEKYITTKILHGEL